MPVSSLKPLIRLLSMGILLLGMAAYAQHDHRPSATPSRATEKADKQELATSEDAMSGMQHGQGGESMGEDASHQHHNGAHMRMSTLAAQKSGDVERAQKIVDEARAALEHYRNFKDAEAEGFKIFLPNAKQKMYHFTNWKYAIEAGFRFNPSHPTSLLYEKISPDDYKLIGAMYTAPQRFSESQLNDRIPLSVAQWHQHVNLCMPPRERRQEIFAPQAQFGLQGSIATEDACKAAGGTFKPVIFGWMVHFYPYEKTMDRIWSVERQLASTPAMAAHQH